MNTTERCVAAIGDRCCRRSCSASLLLAAVAVVGRWPRTSSRSSCQAQRHLDRVRRQLRSGGRRVQGDRSTRCSGWCWGRCSASCVAALANRFRVVDELINPLAVTVAAIPAVVIVGVFNNMYALDSQIGRRIMVTLAVFFIVFVQVAKGLRQIDATQLELMRSYAASHGRSCARCGCRTPCRTCSPASAPRRRSPSSSPSCPSTSAARRTAWAARSPSTLNGSNKALGCAYVRRWIDRWVCVLRRLTSPGVRRRAVATAPHLQVNTIVTTERAADTRHIDSSRTTTRGEHAKQTRFKAITALSIAGLLVAACGDDDEDSGDEHTAGRGDRRRRADATHRRPRRHRPTTRRPPATTPATGDTGRADRGRGPEGRRGHVHRTRPATT